MIRAIHVIPAGRWNGPATDRVVLDYDHRHRRRLAMEGVDGLAFLLDLREAVPLKDGDALELEDGRLVAVTGATEPLAEITAPTAADLIRIAWHLGNRHLPTQTADDRLRIRRDYVIEHMVASLGGTITAIGAPFDPEGGAYGGHHHHHGENHNHRNLALGHDDRLDDGDAADG